MAVIGKPKFDAVAIGEINIKLLGQDHIGCKAAFVDSATGATHGWTQTTTNWSKRTLSLLEELVLSMETDVAERHFSNVQAPAESAQEGPQVSGLGEHLAGSADPPQV